MLCLSCGGEEILCGDLALGEDFFETLALLEAKVFLHVDVHQLVLLRDDGSVAVEEASMEGQEVSSLGITHISLIIIN